MDWIYLAYDWDDWKVIVNTVMNFQIPQYLENSWVADKRLTASHEGPSSTELVTVIYLQDWI
jgi:hypothetical protein